VTFPDHEALLDALRGAGACLADIRALAQRQGPLDPRQVEPLLAVLRDAGEEAAVSRLLQLCAFQGLKLDPELLCSCIGVCEVIVDSAPCFALQDGAAVEPLLRAAAAEELSAERQVYAARLAAELTIRFGGDPQPVRKVLWKLERLALSPERGLLLAQALMILDETAAPGTARIPRWSELPLDALLPEERPRRSIGGDYTVRRPVPKLGRNDPCHCGSGRKYKKCCYARDQELLRDASAYAGTTRSELKANPGMVDDPAVIERMRAHELKRLKPADLSDRQLLTAYWRAAGFGLRELAFELLLESERRSADEAFDPGHFEDLLVEVLEAGDLALAQRIREHCAGRPWWRPQAIAFHFGLLEHPECFAPLEADCRTAVRQDAQEEDAFDEPLIRLAHDFAPRHPALAIVFARAAIASQPERSFDNEMLLDVIRDARVDLDLEPWGDAAEPLFDWIEERTQRRARERAESAEVARLNDRLSAILAALDEKRDALRATERALAQVSAELERARAARPQSLSQGTPQSATPVERSALVGSEEEAALKGLRQQLAALKAEIGDQQAERRKLRRLLADEHRRLEALPPAEEAGARSSAEDTTPVVAPSGRPILPEYSDGFRKRLAALPPPLASKAILAAGRFAAHEAAIWRQTKPLERLPGHYRIRLGLDYRLIVQWQPGETLRILDVIPRQDLESWIRRHG